MCGRFTLITDGEVLRVRFQIANIDKLDIEKRINIAPTQEVLAVINDGKVNKAGFLRWGLIPNWAQDTSIGNKIINARAESVHQKPSFKNLIKRNRCLILADGFIEWKKEDRLKQPYRISLKDNQPFAFAGLWDRYEKNGEKIVSCTIITTEANNLVGKIHNRMPVILTKEHEKLWLDRSYTDTNFLTQLLVPYDEYEMEMLTLD